MPTARARAVDARMHDTCVRARAGFTSGATCMARSEERHVWCGRFHAAILFTTAEFLYGMINIVNTCLRCGPC